MLYCILTFISRVSLLIWHALSTIDVSSFFFFVIEDKCIMQIQQKLTNKHFNVIYEKHNGCHLDFIFK
jgi:hypothetical protein